MKIYHDKLISHYRYPRNRGTITNPTFYGVIHNPSCGDTVIISGLITTNQICKIAFEGQGCVISQAAASMLTEIVTMTSISDAQQINHQTMINLIEIQLGPTRLRCALLAVEALHQALAPHYPLPYHAQ